MQIHPLSLVLAAMLIAASSASSAANGQAPLRRPPPALPQSESEAVTDRLIVKYRASAATDAAADADARAEDTVRSSNRRRGLALRAVKRTAGGAQVFHVGRSMSHHDLRRMAVGLLADNPQIEYIEPDRLLHTQALPNDPMLAQQWSLADGSGGIRATSAWATSIGTGVVVAVIDTGVRPHADLVANLLPGYDFISDSRIAGDGGGRDGDAYDPGDFVTAGYCGSGDAADNSSWHGTHVAGIVAAVGGNGAGVAGVAHGARVLPLRALGKCGGYSSDIASAITWAAGGAVAGVPNNTTPARVINLSLGGTGTCDRTTQAAIDAARARGAVVVVAAGNEAADAATATPANCAGVVAVAASNKAGGRASYSNRGAAVTVSAPGGDSAGAILSTLNAGSTVPAADAYASYAGTSMATPAVSGVVALMLAAKSTLTPDQVATLLKSSARAFPLACSGCGAGIVDAAAAVAAATGAAVAAPAPAPATAPSPPPAPTLPTSVAEVEGNNSLGSAQIISAPSALIKGTISSSTDLDHFKLTLAGGKTLTLVLSMGSASAFGLNLYTGSGSLIASSTGSAGLARQLKVHNSGSNGATLVLRVARTSGSGGAYELSLAQ